MCFVGLEYFCWSQEKTPASLALAAEGSGSITLNILVSLETPSHNCHL